MCGVLHSVPQSGTLEAPIKSLQQMCPISLRESARAVASLDELLRGWNDRDPKTRVIGTKLLRIVLQPHEPWDAEPSFVAELCEGERRGLNRRAPARPPFAKAVARHDQAGGVTKPSSQPRGAKL